MPIVFVVQHCYLDDVGIVDVPHVYFDYDLGDFGSFDFVNDGLVWNLSLSCLVAGGFVLLIVVDGADFVKGHIVVLIVENNFGLLHVNIADLAVFDPVDLAVNVASLAAVDIVARTDSIVASIVDLVVATVVDLVAVGIVEIVIVVVEVGIVGVVIVAVEVGIAGVGVGVVEQHVAAIVVVEIVFEVLVDEVAVAVVNVVVEPVAVVIVVGTDAVEVAVVGLFVAAELLVAVETAV